MGRSLLDREPCPDRVLDDVGVGFAMGALGGSAYHFLKGLCHSPRGTRIAGGMEAMRMNGPRVGGYLAIYGGLYSAFDCTMVFMRQKEDPWNSIIAGATIGGFGSLRKGLSATGRSALVTGAFFALMEGVGLMVHRIDAAQQSLLPLPVAGPNLAAAIVPGHDPNLAAAIVPGDDSFPGLPQSPVAPIEVVSSSGRGSWPGRLLTKEEKKPKGNGGKSEILESFDMPSPPVPTFEYK